MAGSLSKGNKVMINNEELMINELNKCGEE
jgi:hypothetical protein